MDPSAPIISDLSCLDDCFTEGVGKECLGKLIEDVQEKGVCNLESNQGFDPGTGGLYTTSSSCTQYSQNAAVPNIINGTCSAATETNLKRDKCREFILSQPPLIANTATTLIKTACSKDVKDAYLVEEEEYTAANCGCDISQVYAKPDITKIDLPPFPWGRTRGADTRYVNQKNDGTSSIKFNYKSEDIKLTTKLNFTHTRGRYSWICSMRSTDLKHDHFCAVTLLSVPPKPTVIVGPAHCTYLCKDGKNRISSCCCRRGGSDDCSDNVGRCGRDPRVVEMEAADLQILCGEWEIGSTPPAVSGETNNVVLKVLEIIRHPKFNSKEGAFAGNDIAVFKVEDTKLKNGGAQKHKINPVCLPIGQTKKKDTYRGFQAGWSEPPPRRFVQQYVPEFVNLYENFFKQWHYKMDIMRCKDPERSAVSAKPLKCPSDTAYPAGTICAKDFSRQACFSPGESGSPLMTLDDNIERFYVEGILSFVKGRGCDVYSNNPSVYTKLSCFLPWVAEQYGMSYKLPNEKDLFCTEGNPGSISKDPECLQKRLSRENPEELKEKCQTIPSTFQEGLPGAGERDCIFPFYYNGKFYNECIVFTEGEFVYPAFRCPVYNINTKREYNGVMINDYKIDINKTAIKQQTQDCPGFVCQIFQTERFCIENITDNNLVLNAEMECIPELRRAPFSVCKNNCPGGRLVLDTLELRISSFLVNALGIIGGGALALTATALTAQSFILPALGFGKQ